MTCMFHICVSSTFLILYDHRHRRKLSISTTKSRFGINTVFKEQK